MKYENLLRIRRVGRRDVNCLAACVCVCVRCVCALCVCVLYLCVYLCVCVFAFLLGSFLMQPQKLIGLWIVICDRQQGQSGNWRRNAEVERKRV